MVREKFLRLLLSAAGFALARPVAAQPVMLVIDRTMDAGTVSSVNEAQDSLVAGVRRDWRASLAPALPGWGQALRDAEHASGLRWRGLPAVILRVPDDGHGFRCDEQRCLGRYLGARIQNPGKDGGDVIIASIVLIAESALTRPDVLQHELTHALLAQYGLFEASLRHDRRYFRRDVASFARNTTSISAGQ